MSSPAAVRVTEHVRADIISGRIEAGTRLTEKLLSERYEVSRVPVRECLRALEAEGLVEVRSYAGATVAHPEPENVDVLFDVRLTLETEMIRRATLRAVAQLGREAPDPEWWRLRREIAAVLSEGDAALASGDLAAMPTCNQRFHSLLAEMSDSASLAGVLRQVAGKIERLFAWSGTNRGDSAWSEHKKLIALVDAGDAEAAVAFMAAHLERSRTGLRGSVSAAGARGMRTAAREAPAGG